MQVVNDYVLVRVEPVKEKTSTGILLPDGSQKLPGRGTVEGVAPGIEDVKVGDKVEFLRYAAIEGPEEDLRFCKLDHILAIYES